MADYEPPIETLSEKDQISRLLDILHQREIYTNDRLVKLNDLNQRYVVEYNENPEGAALIREQYNQIADEQRDEYASNQDNCDQWTIVNALAQARMDFETQRTDCYMSDLGTAFDIVRQFGGEIADLVEMTILNLIYAGLDKLLGRETTRQDLDEYIEQTGIIEQW